MDFAAWARGHLADPVPDDRVILFVPSHDSEANPLPDQDQWADASLQLMSHLFGGVTGFLKMIGGWKDATGRVHRDEPIMMQILVQRERLDRVEVLEEFAGFCRRMRVALRQKAVACVINDRLYLFEEVSPRVRETLRRILRR